MFSGCNIQYNKSHIFVCFIDHLGSSFYFVSMQKREEKRLYGFFGTEKGQRYVLKGQLE